MVIVVKKPWDLGGLCYMKIVSLLIFSFILTNAFNLFGACNFDHIIDDVAIQEAINKGCLYADKYTDSKLLAAFSNIEDLKKQQQSNWNASLLTTVHFPFSLKALSIGIYNSDILKIFMTSSFWLIEWMVYKATTNIITETVVNYWKTNHVALQALIETLGTRIILTEDEIQNVEKMLVPSISLLLCKIRFLLPLICYASMTTILQRYHTLFQLNSTINVNPQPLWSIVPSTPFAFLTAVHPQNFTITINTFFKNIGFLPIWSESALWLVNKEIIAQWLWLYCYSKNIIITAVKTHIVPNFKYVYELMTENVSLQLFVHNRLHSDYFQWSLHKIAYTSTIQSALNIVLAAPVGYKIGRELYGVLAPFIFN